MGPAWSRKYATATHIYIPMIVRGAVDFAVGATWTPAAGDVTVRIDGGTAANIGTLPTALAMGNTAVWDFTISTGETTGKKIVVMIADAATKAVEDNAFEIETYGHPSAEYITDFTDDNIVRGVVTTGATTTSIPTSSLSPAAVNINQFQGRVVIFDRATTTAGIRGEAVRVSSSDTGGILTVTAISQAPVSGDTFKIV